MFICPTCGEQFEIEGTLVRHMSKCWREKNPTHKSKSAPHSEDVNTREYKQDIIDFFNSFK